MEGQTRLQTAFFGRSHQSADVWNVDGATGERELFGSTNPWGNPSGWAPRSTVHRNKPFVFSAKKNCKLLPRKSQLRMRLFGGGGGEGDSLPSPREVACLAFFREAAWETTLKTSMNRRPKSTRPEPSRTPIFYRIGTRLAGNIEASLLRCLSFAKHPLVFLEKLPPWSVK